LAAAKASEVCKARRPCTALGSTGNGAAGAPAAFHSPAAARAGRIAPGLAMGGAMELLQILS